MIKVADLNAKGGSLTRVEEGCCSVCFEEGKLIGLDSCPDKHLFCEACWTEYIESLVTSKQVRQDCSIFFLVLKFFFAKCPLVTCMGDGCSSILEDQFVPERLNQKLSKMCALSLASLFHLLTFPPKFSYSASGFFLCQQCECLLLSESKQLPWNRRAIERRHSGSVLFLLPGMITCCFSICFNSSI